jgi:hypothetical protein
LNVTLGRLSIEDLALKIGVLNHRFGIVDQHRTHLLTFVERQYAGCHGLQHRVHGVAEIRGSVERRQLESDGALLRRRPQPVGDKLACPALAGLGRINDRLGDSFRRLGIVGNDCVKQLL